MKTVILLALAVVSIAHPQVPLDLSASSYSYGSPDLETAASALNGLETEEDPLADLAANIPGNGIPGVDYPILDSLPDTGFSCVEQQFPGYFADTADEANCQVFHICQFDGRQDSFLCPNGTIFNQQYFVCDWWFNVDCSATDQFLSLNLDIGKLPDEVEAAASEIVAPSSSYGVPLL